MAHWSCTTDRQRDENPDRRRRRCGLTTSAIDPRADGARSGGHAHRNRSVENVRSHSRARCLKRLIPICAYCHKIHTAKDYWQRFETYIKQQTGSEFSHGICPECLEAERAKLKCAS